MKENYFKNNRGITLMALVITIIVLLILAGVTIAMVVRDDGIMSKAEKAKRDTINGQKETSNDLDLMEQFIDEEQLGQIPIVLRIASDATGNITLPIKEDCQVDWNYVFENNPKYEGNFVDVNSNSTYINYHYEDNSSKDRTIAIKGNVTEISRDYMDNWNDETSIKEVLSWGTTGLTKIDLHRCKNLEKIAGPNFKSFEKVKSFCNLDNYHGSFQGCINLTEIPKNLFANCPNVTDFSGTFQGTNITSIPENLFANCPNVTDFSETFGGTNIISIPKNLFANCPNVTDFYATFKNTKITSIPENLFENCPNVRSFSYTFYNARITSIPKNLFVNCSNVEYFLYTFANCNELVGNPLNLWKRVTTDTKTYIGNPDGGGCYFGSGKEPIYIAEVPDYWKNYFDEDE